MRHIRQLERRARLALNPLLIAVGVAIPAQLAAQAAPRTTAVFEGYVARAALHPTVAGTRTPLAGAGARLLLPLESFLGPESAALARRTAVGGFVTSVSTDDGGVSAQHYGLHADMRLLDTPLAGRVDPLVSLGTGVLHGQRIAGARAAVGSLCLRPLDVPGPTTSPTCVRPPREDPAAHGTYLAVSPAAGVRVGLLPGLALRADVRDVIVYRGGPRHNLEIGTGLSLLRW
jgi:hypothetical protein